MLHTHEIGILLLTIICIQSTIGTSDGTSRYQKNKNRHGNDRIGYGRGVPDPKKPSKEVEKLSKEVELTKEGPLTNDILYIYNLTYGWLEQDLLLQLKETFDNPKPILQKNTMKPISFVKQKFPRKNAVPNKNGMGEGIAYFIKIGAKVDIKRKIEQKYFHLRYFQGAESDGGFGFMFTGIEKNKYYAKDAPIKPFGIFKGYPDEYDTLTFPRLKIQSIHTMGKYV